MHFISRQQLVDRFAGKSVAIVGSGPGATTNPPGLVDSHDIVVRVNNFKLIDGTGQRTDVFYSFFGNSIRKGVAGLMDQGVTLCMAKCPNGQIVDSPWHRKHNAMRGVDFRWIYEKRRDWWFCDTYIPDRREFGKIFTLLGNHVPTTGFAAIWTIMKLQPRALFLTGFDFFRSGLHNVNEDWWEKNMDDPIRHMPELELQWLRDHITDLPIGGDAQLFEALGRLDPPPRRAPPPHLGEAGSYQRRLVRFRRPINDL